MATEKTEVVIVGVGAAGGIIAAELAKAGMKVIGLERGPRLKTADFEGLDELRYFERQDLRPNIKREPVTWRPNANAHATPMPVLNNGNQAGGGTVHYGTLSWRMHEDDFRVRTKTVERYGASAIPDDSSLVDWPVSYAELEPFYDQAEYDLGVSGKAGNLQGKKIDGGNVFEAPRSRDYPMPALLVDQSGLLYEAGARKLGLHPFPSPRAILSQPYKDRPACTYCGFCQSFGCYIGAKSSILVTKLPEADATGNFKLITGAMCYRVNSDNSRQGDRRVLLRPRPLRQHDRGRDRHPGALHLRQYAADAVVEDGQIPERACQFERPSRQAHHGAYRWRTFSSPSTTATSTTTWARARRSTPSTTSTPTISITRASASSAARNCRSARRTSKAARSPPRPWRRRPACRAGARAIATSSPSTYARHGAMVAQTENLPYADQTIDLDPERARCLGHAGAARHLRLAAAEREGARRVRAEQARGDRPRHGRARKSGAAPVSPAGAPGAHHEGGTRMGSDPKDSVVNKYGQTWDHPESVPGRQLDLPDHGRGLQPDADHPGARLYEGRCHRKKIPEQSGAADLTATPRAGLSARGSVTSRRDKARTP